jgi:NAD(P)-dependent dehydrogenase (short-subunit alcohol dehydrogenase family)
MTKELAGQTAFVTGSGRGLGRAIASRLAEMGANVAIHDLDFTAPSKYGESPDLGAVTAAIAAHGVRTTYVTGNIGDPTAVAQMATEIGKALGEVNILVNCAGGDIGASGNKPNPNNALDISETDIRTLVNNNLIGTFLVTQTFVKPMRERGAGTIVNIASAAAHMGCSPEAIYATLKAAVVHYTRCLALELRPHGVRVNAVSPGPSKTARFAATRKTDPAMMEGNHALVRYGDPTDIADAVGFLASHRSRFIHGQVLRVDGGLTLSPG